ncbi:reticulon-like protein B21 [Prosopis cineraria]|uniref:reticulon-like protein B21 n=1 Tax=Prosopis cineraria TaxID=364024 RepID=UPI00240F6B74|nr:reticulon-like protein B21 [Prosopis cineraria]
MDVARRRIPSRTSSSTTATSSTVVVAAGSVWESRMKSDEVKGGIKVFNGDDNSDEVPPNAASGTASRLKRSTVGSVAASGKRRMGKSDNSSDATDKAQMQIAKGKSESGLKNCDEQCKELNVSSDGIKKSPIPTRRPRTGGASIPGRKLRSEVPKDAVESSEGPGRSLRKSKSDSMRTANQNNVKSVGENNSAQLRKTKSASDPVLDESSNGINGRIENVTAQNEKDDDTDENCKDFGVCEEKLISSSTENVSETKCSPELSVLVDGDADGSVDEEAETDEDGDKEEDAVDETIETEAEESFDVKEISIPTEPKIVKESENNETVNEQEKKMVVKKPENNNTKVANELDKKVVVKEPEKKAVIDEPVNKKAVNVNQPEPKKIQSTYRRFQQNYERPVSIPAVTVKQSPPVKRHSTIYQNFSKDNSHSKYHSFPQTQSKLQSLVDLVMWRDISRSAFVFGIGTFVVISSSYAQDINVSFISVLSYLGLVYLAVIFLHRSLICRGVIDVDDKNYVLGEEEATWVLKLILPYLNELLSKLRALFSGDPGTTMKLAVLLFVLARCGNSITIWKMAKFGFFGVFTVPKVCSSYSAQLTSYANFWVRRFRDAWDSCSHKKAVALGIFSLVWNMSSVVARVWAVFVLFVAFKYYQQHYMVRDEYVEEEEEEEEGNEGDTWQEASGGKIKGVDTFHWNQINLRKDSKYACPWYGQWCAPFFFFGFFYIVLFFLAKKNIVLFSCSNYLFPIFKIYSSTTL